MARIRKEYKMTEKNVEYIEEVKEKNNLKYSSEALDLIIREHRQNSDITTEAMIKIIAKEVSEQIKFDMKEIKKSSNDTDRNTQILLELINGFFVISEYGMISSTVNNTATVRNVFIIDDKQIVRTILVYPMNIGRNIPEILRVVRALQVADCNNQMAPVNWMPNEPMIVPMPQTFAQLQERNENIMKQQNGMNWYLSFQNPEKLCLNENEKPKKG